MTAYAGLAFLSFLWGSSFLLIKIASRAFDPLGFALARVGVAAAAMLLTSALSGKVWPGARPGLWAKLLALALIGQVAPFLLLGKAATLTTSADMALMMGAQPIFVFLLGRILGSRDQWTWFAALGLALGFAGVGAAIWSPGADSGAHSVLGRAFALAAGVSYGTGAIISGAATREIGAVRAVTASMTLSTLVLALIGFMFGRPPQLAALVQTPLAPMLAMGALGVFNTALAYYVYFRLVHDEGPTFASLNNYIVPLIGVVGGAVALAEPIAPSAWAGLALVLCGVALTGRSLRPAKAARAAFQSISRTPSPRHDAPFQNDSMRSPRADEKRGRGPW
jgi:drug/metabolite transporter (DMT)-like permease